jgi:hypothetical protein
MTIVNRRIGLVGFGAIPGLVRELITNPRARANGRTSCGGGFDFVRELIEICSLKPMTGFFRDGCCNTALQDVVSHAS